MTEPNHDAGRWKPLRAGIRNIWEYDEQVFTFADGRMILRGPNGSGKSNALALIFPFLFDGTMSAAAMDPFAGGRSMKSLLLGVLRDDTRSGFRHDQRLGYVWLEFVRPGAHGDEHLTVGSGARARADGDARSWFFVTDRRVGIDLDLAPGDTPLTRGALIEQLGSDAVRDGAEEHRQVVARDLLGIDIDQLGKLNGLIRALRRPQLAGKLNVEELSAVLSSGLPAIAATTLDDVAASLDDLERVQHELAAVRDALATVNAFLPTYRTYLGGEARRRAAVVLDHDHKLAEQQRGRDRLEKRHDRLVARDAELRAKRSDATERQTETTAKRDALKDSERFKGASELKQEESLAATLASAAEGAKGRREEAEREAERLEARASATEQQARTAEVEAERWLRSTIDRADRVRASWALDEDEQADPVRLRAAVDVMVNERRGAISTIRGALRALERASVTHRAADDARSAADEAFDAASAQRNEAVAERERRQAELTEQVAAWAATAPGLDHEQRAELVELVNRVPDGEAIAPGERYRLLSEPHRDGLRDQRSELRQEAAELAEQRAELVRERDRVAAEQDLGPAVPAWRTGDRTGRAGAPLWACCDFAPGAGLAPEEQAGIEAALEAAGLLDAWIQPDGIVGDDLDAWLLSGAVGIDRNEPTLSSVLSVAVPDGSHLTTETVEAVLAHVHLGAVGIAVAPDGRFALGPLAGRAAKPVAEFIGAPARAARRARRLAELASAIAGIDAELESLDRKRAAVNAALAALDETARSAPETSLLTEAARGLRVAEDRERIARDRAGEAAEKEAAAAAAVSRASTDLEREAGRLAVPMTADELDAFAPLVEQFGDSGREAAQQRGQATRLLALAAEQRSDADASRSAAQDRGREAEDASLRARSQRLRVDTLRGRLGPDVTSVFDEIAALDQRLLELGESVRSFGVEIETNRENVGQAAGALAAADERIAAAGQELRASERRLPVLRGRELLALLDLPLDDLPLEPVAFAGWMADQLGGPPDEKDHDQAKRAVDRAQKQLIDDLHQGYAPGIVHDDDLILVEVTSDDRSVFGLAELRTRLERQASEMEQHLTDSDREIFERHLLNRVSHELRRLLGEADEFVRGVNEALARTKTASGLQVELRWVAAGDDAETRRALDLLRRDTDQMGDDDRAALRQFFDLAIKRQRAEDPDAGYRSNLEQVVDYRQWHRFQPYLVGPDGRAQLTRQRFRGLSGGEQAVALHLPLFAAAAAHYDRAALTAPRLVALDEAFAGIDEAMRGELLGLTVAFDLDVLLTGHELWGAYAEVPEIAVHDLLRRPPLEGVSVLTLRWNGKELDEVAAEPAGTANGRSAAAPTGLFVEHPDP